MCALAGHCIFTTSSTAQIGLKIVMSFVFFYTGSLLIQQQDLASSASIQLLFQTSDREQYYIGFSKNTKPAVMLDFSDQVGSASSLVFATAQLTFTVIRTRHIFYLVQTCAPISRRSQWFFFHKILHCHIFSLQNPYERNVSILVLNMHEKLFIFSLVNTGYLPSFGYIFDLMDNEWWIVKILFEVRLKGSLVSCNRLLIICAPCDRY